MDEKKKDHGGSAFPLPEFILSSGMTLRDYFAAAAMNGAIQRGIALESDETLRPVNVAARSYEYADAMLAERAKK